MELKQMLLEWCELSTQSVIEGETFALATFADMADMAQAIASAMERVKEYAVKEAVAYPENKFSFAGRTFTKVPARQMVKYDHVPQWKQIADRRKRIEQLSLQAAKTFGVTIVDDETGEVIEAAQITFTKPSISVK
jgi:hypothetical protein